MGYDSRLVAVSVCLAGMLAVAGCTVNVTSTPSTPSEPATGSAPPTNAEPAPTTAAEPGDLADPCTLLSADQINAALGTDFSEGKKTDDSARQITTCQYTSADGTKIVAVTLSQVDGAKSFKLNTQLAPAYFGGKAKTIELPGADDAYLVIADTFQAPVVGMLVNGHFVLVQVGVEGTTPEQGQALAEQVAARVP